MSEEILYKKIIRCNNINKLRGLEMYLYRVRHMWKKVSNHGERLDDDKEQLV
jgi:hypothetical protein